MSTRCTRHVLVLVISQGAFADLIVCLTEFSKNMKFQKKGLQLVGNLEVNHSKMLKTPECPLSTNQTQIQMDLPKTSGNPRQNKSSRTSQEEAFWFPVLFAFHDVLMTGEDLEVRSKCTQLLVRISNTIRRGFPSRLLGYPLETTSLSHLHGTKVKV